MKPAHQYDNATLEELERRNMGLRFLMPLAIEQLRQKPLSHADAGEEIPIICERARELAAAEGTIVVRAIEEASSVFLAAGKRIAR
jgi:hypothetical protein